MSNRATFIVIILAFVASAVLLVIADRLDQRANQLARERAALQR